MKNNPKELVDDLNVIRTIHSNKARTFSKWNFYYLLITILVAVIVTFIGFSGPENIAALITKSPKLPNNDNKNVAFVMNLMTLSILVISILGLILQFEGKMNRHDTAVVRITEFTSDIQFNYLSDSVANLNTFKVEDLKLYSERYKALLNSLPATTDKDYYAALRTIKRKNKIKAFIKSDDYDKMNSFSRWLKIKWL